MKKNISELKFQSITGWRGDSLCCPQAFGGDIYSGCSMGCWWCFCREMEQEMYEKYYTGWSRELVRSADPDTYRQLFDRAFGSDKPTKEWTILALRHGLPFNMGSKAETFCVEDFKENKIVPILELFKEYHVPVIFETKSHFIGMSRYLDIIKDLKCAVIVAIMGGTDTLNYKLEPGAPPASMRWQLVGELNRKGVWCGVRWEPIMYGINSSDECLESYADQAKKYGAKHVSFYNYRTSNAKIAWEEFDKRGYNYGKLLEGNQDKTWRPIGKRFFQILRERGVKASSPDFVNFPFDSSYESCCGVDDLFPLYEFTFQHACQIIKRKGSVHWDDMEAITFREPESYERMKQVWNGQGQYFSLAQSPDIVVLGLKDGYNIYGRSGDSVPETDADIKPLF
jgi:DNA repair photolyase